MNWQRARTDDKKNERKDAIYQAALSLFKEKGYEGVSFNAIASEAGFTKSNMYRYFSSKEEIFLNIFKSLFEDWSVDCTQKLQALKQNPDVSEFAQTWVASHTPHPQFLDLTTILFISLEANSSYEQLLEFKTRSMELLYQLAVEISKVYPQFDNEKAFRFLTLSFAASGNYWAAESKQNDALHKIYQLEPFKDMKPDYEKNLIASVEVIIRGLLATN